jgi:transcriptional regulator GlxA family with amidase domain
MSDSIDLNATEAETAVHVCFLMLPEYTLSAFSNAVGILRMANRLTDRRLYSWSVFSLDGQPLISSAGLELSIDGSLEDAADANIMMVCGGYQVKKYCDKALTDGLRKVAKKKNPHWWH